MKKKEAPIFLIALAFVIGVSSFYIKTTDALTIKYIGDVAYTDGSLLRSPGGDVLVFENDALHKVPDPATFDARGYDWSTVIDADEALLAEFSESFAFLPEGATIRAHNTPDVYIIKYVGTKQFKRLVLNPSVFESYGHLRWEDVLDVDQAIADSFPSVNIVRVSGTDQVYRLTPDGDIGVRQTITSDKMIALGYDSKSIYEINAIDFDSYFDGVALGGESTVCSSVDCFLGLVRVCQLGELDNMDYTMPEFFWGPGLENIGGAFLKIVGTDDSGACVFVQEPRVGKIVISDDGRQEFLDAGKTGEEVDAVIQELEEIFNKGEFSQKVRSRCSGTGTDIATYVTNLVEGSESGSISCAFDLETGETSCTLEPNISCTSWIVS